MLYLDVYENILAGYIFYLKQAFIYADSNLGSKNKLKGWKVMELENVRNSHTFIDTQQWTKHTHTRTLFDLPSPVLSRRSEGPSFAYTFTHSLWYLFPLNFRRANWQPNSICNIFYFSWCSSQLISSPEVMNTSNSCSSRTTVSALWMLCQ